MIRYEWKKEWWTSHGTLTERPETIVGLEGCDIEDCDHGKELSEWNTPAILFSALTDLTDGYEVGCLEIDNKSGKDVWAEICLVMYFCDDDEESIDMIHLYVTPAGKWYCPDEEGVMPPKRFQNEFRKFMK